VAEWNTTGSQGSDSLARLSQDGLESFEAWAASNCPDCGTVLSTLLRGVEQAGFLDTASFEDESLKVKLKEPQLYGEVASPSKVLVMWKLDQSMTFNITKKSDEVHISIEGLHALPPAQSKELYNAALSKAGLDGGKCKELECMQTEIKAMNDYVKDHADELKAKPKKISILFNKAYGSSLARAGMNMAKMFTSAANWGQVLYAFCVAMSPIKFQSFTFQGGLMSAKWEEDYGSDFYVANHFAEKRQVLQEIELAMGKKIGISPATAARLESWGKSLAPGMMSTSMVVLDALMDSDVKPYKKEMMAEFGFTDEWIQSRRPKPKLVAKLMSFCAASVPGEDPPCKGKTPGRVSWGPNIPGNFA